MGLRGFALRRETEMKSLASAEVLSETRGRLLSLAADDRALWGKMTAIQMATSMNPRGAV